MSILLSPLEGVLSGWEDYMLLHGTSINLKRLEKGLAPISFKSGPLKHFQSFRSYLLRLGTGIAKVEDLLGKFIPAVDDQIQFEFGISELVSSLPIPLSNWSVSSRRLYSLDKITQLKIENTSLDNIPWDYFHFPFDSYLIELPFGLPHWKKDNDYCWMLFSKIHVTGGNSYQFYVFNNCVSDYEAISNKTKSKLKSLIKNKDIATADSLIKNLESDYYSKMLWESLTLTEVGKKFSVVETIDQGLDYFIENNLTSTKKTEEWKIFWNKALRLVLGLPLYLRSLPPKNNYINKVVGKVDAKRAPGRAIFDPKEVCSVTCDFRLTDSQRNCLEKSTRDEIENAWKWVEGHWRRPPGRGNDPEAERTVEVKSYIVGEQYMPDSPALTRGARKSF